MVARGRDRVPETGAARRLTFTERRGPAASSLFQRFWLVRLDEHPAERSKRQWLRLPGRLATCLSRRRHKCPTHHASLMFDVLASIAGACSDHDLKPLWKGAPMRSLLVSRYPVMSALFLLLLGSTCFGAKPAATTKPALLATWLHELASRVLLCSHERNGVSAAYMDGCQGRKDGCRGGARGGPRMEETSWKDAMPLQAPSAQKSCSVALGGSLSQRILRSRFALLTSKPAAERKAAERNIGTRIAYGGYALHSGSTSQRCRVRYRMLDSELGKWTRRDPAEYVDGPNVYGYATDGPVNATDPSGLCTTTVRCRYLTMGQNHCVLYVCCPGQPCQTYSLNPSNGWPVGPAGDNPVDRSPNQPIDIEPSLRWKDGQRWTDPALAKCIQTTIQEQLDDVPPWRYDPFNCNSNWFIGSVLQCCLGHRPDPPPHAFGWDSCCNRRSTPIFQCSNDPNAGPFNKDCVRRPFQEYY